MNQWSWLLAWGVGAMFIPSLALGVLSGSNKTFEGLYLIVWYLGPWNKIYYLDFMGTTETAQALHMPFYYLVITLILLMAALARRRQQLRA